jgi:hypothetical protein
VLFVDAVVVVSVRPSAHPVSGDVSEAVLQKGEDVVREEEKVLSSPG